MWSAIQTILGAALVAEADPNTTEPPPSRTLHTGRTAITVRAQLVDGTSVDLTPWGYEETLDVWLQLGATKTVVTTAPVLVDVVPDGLVFLQVTNVVGGPTKCVIAP